MTKICLYSICGDNERDEDLERWNSCAKEADGSFILYTGRSDATWEKLKALTEDNSRLFVNQKAIEPFRFDEARNESIELAEELFPKADVFFTIDMDEWMAPGWTKTIKRRFLKLKHVRIAYSHRHYEAEKPASRNWGHVRGWRWRYPCHEVMYDTTTDEIWYDRENELDLTDNLEVVHYRNPAKPRSSYLGLLKTRWHEFKDTASLAYLVREYYYNSDWASILEMSDVIEVTCKEEGTESCMAWTVLGLAYENRGQMGDAERAYRKAVETGPTLRRGYTELGRFLIEQKRPDEAYVVLFDGYETTVFSQRGIFVDPSDLWTWRYYDWLCVASYWSERLANHEIKALHWALKALESAPDNTHVQTNLTKSYELLRRRWR